MQGIAEFHKVSFDQFFKDAKENGFLDDHTDHEVARLIWEGIKLPARATNGSAGYDFFAPFSFSLKAGSSITIPTCVNVDMQPGWCLMLLPRSSLGFGYGMYFQNTTPLIDSDFYYANNEGHIIAKISVEKDMTIHVGDRFAQGVFIPHGLTRSDNRLGLERTGGIGSTGES